MLFNSLTYIFFLPAVVPRSRMLLALAVVFNLVSLGVFKYLGLLDSTAASFAHPIRLRSSWPIVDPILPLGLPFFTFDLHYQIDLYLRRPAHPVPDRARPVSSVLSDADRGPGQAVRGLRRSGEGSAIL